MQCAVFSAAVLSLLVIPTASAREWTDSTGKNKTEAEFVDIQDGVVQLKRKDGRTVAVPISRLSAADQIFAFQESARLEAVVPKLGDEGKKHALELLKAVRRVCAPLDGKQDANNRDLERTIEDAKKEFLVHSARIVDAEGSRRAVTPVIIVLLRDMNFAVRAAGVSLIEELGKSASAALSAVAQLLNDKNQHVRRMASDVLSVFSEETDVAAPALVELIGGADVELAKRAAQSLSQIQASGPRYVSVVPKLVAQVKDTTRKSELRVIAASALSQILWRLQPDGYDGFDRRSLRNVQRLLEHREFDSTPEEIRRALTELAGFDETLVPNTCRQLLSGLSDEDNAVRGAVAIVISTSAPQLIAELPNATFVKLLMEPSPVLEGRRRDDSNSLVNAALGLTEEGRMPVKLTPEQAVGLLAREESEYQMFAQSQLQLMGGKAKAALPELVKLTANQRAGVRSTALSMLSSQLFSQREDLATMPTLPVRVSADEQGQLKSITFQGEPVADAEKLKEMVATYKPPASKTGVDIDVILKRALSDSDEDVRYVALRGLGSRGTAAAQSILRETQRTAVDREIREMAGQMLAVRDRRVGRFEFPLEDERSDDSDKSPFRVDEPEKKSEPSTIRDFAVVLAVDPALKLKPFHAILTAISEGQATGIRLSGTTVAAELQLRPQKESKGDEYGIEQRLEEHLSLRLTAKTGDGRAELSLRTPSNERWMRVPNYEALQFLLNFTFPSRGDQRLQMRMELDYGEAGSIGRDALPYLVTLRGDPDIPVADLVATLNAVGAVNDEKFGQRDLLQWVKFSVDDKPAQLWFLKVAEPDATEK